MGWSAPTGWNGDGWSVAAAVVATTTLNPSDKSATAALSNGNLTLSGTGAGVGYFGARSVASASSGKKFWQIAATTIGSGAGSIVEGPCNSSAVLTSFIGVDTNGVGWAGNGSVFLNSANIGPIQTWAQGDILSFAFDITNSLIWFRTNSGNWNNNASANPATGVGGLSVAALVAGPYFAAVQGDINTDVMTINFGGSAYSPAAPSGFGNL